MSAMLHPAVAVFAQMTSLPVPGYVWACSVASKGSQPFTDPCFTARVAV